MFSLTKAFSAISRVLRPVGDEAEDLQLARRQPELADLVFVHPERRGRRLDWNLNFADDDLGCLAGDRQSEPDAEPREQRGDQRAVDLDRVFDDQVLVLDKRRSAISTPLSAP